MVKTEHSEISTEEPWVLQDEIFDPRNMMEKLNRFADEEGLVETKKALKCAAEKHAGAVRKGSPYAGVIPYIIHPLTMACQAHALGIRDDRVLSVCLLHDVCEDCNVTPEELPFSKAVQKSVALMTKHREEGESEEQMDRRYYAALAEDPCASLVKILDRCNNVSLMALSFSRAKLTEYIHETERFSLPLLDTLRHRYPQYADAAFLVKYQIRSILETIKALLNHSGEF